MTTVQRFPLDAVHRRSEDFIEHDGSELTHVGTIGCCVNCATPVGVTADGFVDYWRDAASNHDERWCEDCVDCPDDLDALLGEMQLLAAKWHRHALPSEALSLMRSEHGYVTRFGVIWLARTPNRLIGWLGYQEDPTRSRQLEVTL